MINTSRLRLVIALMAIAAIIIIALAVYIFTHFSTLESSQGIILAIIGVAALFIVMSVVAVLMKSVTSGNKTTNTKK